MLLALNLNSGFELQAEIRPGGWGIFRRSNFGSMPDLLEKDAPGCVLSPIAVFALSNDCHPSRIQHRDSAALCSTACSAANAL